MANLDGPFGLVPYKSLHGGPVTPANEYAIASGYSSNIFTGDPVKLVAGGGIEVAAAGDAGITGVFAGVEYTDTDGNVVFKKYWPASTATLNSEDAKASVYDDPDLLYLVQADDDGTALTKADIGQNADLLAGTGSTTFGQSRYELDQSTKGTSAALQVRIMGLHTSPDNAFESTGNTKLIVRINEARNDLNSAGI